MATVSYQPPAHLDERPTGKTISRSAFIIILIVLIIFAIIIIILMILYFSQNANCVNPSSCPKKVVGVVATPDTDIDNLASNCGSTADCTFTVNDLNDAVTLCKSFGPTKCESFSLQLQTGLSTYTMKVCSDTGTTTSTGSNTYVIMQ
jgi:hypothetical protein